MVLHNTYEFSYIVLEQCTLLGFQIYFRLWTFFQEMGLKMPFSLYELFSDDSAIFPHRIFLLQKMHIWDVWVIRS